MKIIAHVLCVVIGLAAAGLFLLRIVFLSDTPPDNQTAIETEEVADLRHLVSAGMIRTTGGDIVVSPADARLNQPDAVPADLHQILYGSASGAYLRSLVTLWRHTRLILAVRDNQMAVTDPVLVSSGSQAGWHVEPVDVSAGGARPIPFAEVPLTYAFLTGTLVPDMGAWSVRGMARNSPMRLSTTFVAARAGSITVELIGDLVEAPPAMVVDNRCAKPCHDGALRGVRLTMQVPAPGTYPITLMVRPVPNRGIVVPGLRLQVSPTADISLAPSSPDPSTVPPPAAPALLVSADGVALTDADGRLTLEAHALNLMPMIGFGAGDPRGVVAALASRTRDRGSMEIGMTVDTHFQRQAQGVLDELTLADGQRAMLVMMDADNGDIVASAQVPRIDSQRINDWDLLAVTREGIEPSSPWTWQVLDGAVPGSTFKLVIAMAVAEAAGNNPALMAFIKGCAIAPGGQVPCIGLAAGDSKYRMPGQSRLIGNFRHETIAGSLPSRPQSGADALSAPDCQPAGAGSPPQTFSLSTAIAHSVNIAFVKLQEMLDGPAALSYRTQVRRRQADAPPPLVPDFAVNRVTARLGLEQPLDLLYPVAGMVANGKLRMLPRARGEAMQSDMQILMEHGKGWELLNPADLLAQMAIGARVRLTPLHIAMMSASLASGHVSKPRLVASWNGLDLPVAAKEDLALSAEGAAAIKAGMAAVTQVGTAKGAFAHWSQSYPGAVCHVAGKTGSGTLPRPGTEINADGSPKEKDWTVSFTGYADPQAFWLLARPGVPGRARHVAFACMITNLQDSSATGGKLCAPLVSRMLERVARNHPDDVRAAH